MVEDARGTTGRSYESGTGEIRRGKQMRCNMAKCVICGKKYSGYGNNADPVAKGECCDDCNLKVVVPARIKQIYGSQNERSKQNETRKVTSRTRR